MRNIFSTSLCLGACACLFSISLPAADTATFLLRGATIHTISGADIEHGDLLVRDGKIAGLGAKLSAPKGVRVIEGKGLHVYPGLIDSATEMGLAEIGAVRETADTTEIGDLHPQLRAAGAVNPAREPIPVTRANGITTTMTLPQGRMPP